MDGDNTRGQILRTIGWFLVSIAGLGVIGRSGVKAGVIRRFGADDVFIWLAFLCFLGQAVCVHLEVARGLGQPRNQVDDGDVSLLLKLDWAQDLLFMPVYGFAKLSVVSLLRKFTLGKRDRLLLYTFEWILALWAISSEVVWAFECSLPMPWDYLGGSCINRTVWITFFEGVNIVTDFMLIIMPSLVILSLKAPLKRRLTSASFFIARICILPASIARIYYWVIDTRTQGVTYNIFTYMLATMIVCALEIIAGCILYLQPLFETLESGFMWGGDLRRRGQTFHTIDYCARGSLPFTKMRNPFDETLFTGQQTAYSVRAEGPAPVAVEDEEKLVDSAQSSPRGIQVNQAVDIHSSPDPIDRVPLPPTIQEVADERGQSPPHASAKWGGRWSGGKDGRSSSVSRKEKKRKGDKKEEDDDAKRDSGRSSASLGEAILPFIGFKRSHHGRRLSETEKRETNAPRNENFRTSIPKLDILIPRSSLHVPASSQPVYGSSDSNEEPQKALPPVPGESAATSRSVSRRPSQGW